VVPVEPVVGARIECVEDERRRPTVAAAAGTLTESVPVTFDTSGPKSQMVPLLWWCLCVCGTHVSAPLVPNDIGT
jgi:hypothetical protein